MAFFEAKKAGGGGQLVFDYKTWLASASLSATGYANLDAVLQDDLAVRKLMTIHASVDYLAGWKTTDEDIVKILSNDICAKWITLRDYALDTLDKEYRSLMESLGKYYYGEWALMPQVPKMTSNTAPYGECIYSTQWDTTSYNAYKAFDGNTSSLWASASGDIAGAYVGYHFPNKVLVKKLRLYPSTSNSISTFKVRGSNDGNSWVDISDVLSITEWNKYLWYDIPADTAYNYIIIEALTSTGSSDVSVCEVQFYAWAPKGNVPIMTSNTAPYGTASAYQVFDGNASTTASGTDFSYQFVNPICPKDFICKNASGQDITGGTLQASNDGSTWAAPVDGEYYLNLRVHFAASTTVATVQFYGRELKVSVPVMTSNTAPYGEAIKDFKTYTVVQDAWKAFSGSVYARCSGGSNYAGVYVGYGFTHKAKIKLFKWRYSTDISGQTAKLKFIASNDKTNWVDASEEINFTQNMADADCYTVSTIDDAYKYWALYVVSSTGSNTNATFRFMNFYGFDYSEYDWDANNPRHYLYDHGVELETITSILRGTGDNTLTKEDSQLLLVSNSTTGTIDAVADYSSLSSFNLIRTCVGNKEVLLDSGRAIVYSTKDTSGTNIAVGFFTLKDAPNNESLDISSVSAGYPLIRPASNGDIATTSIAEWWLE